MNIIKANFFLKDIYLNKINFIVCTKVYWQDSTHVFDSRGAGFQSTKEEGIDLL